MRKLYRYGLIILTLFLVGLLVFAAVSELRLLFAVQFDEELKASRSFQYQYPTFNVLIFLHITMGLIFLATGGYQLIPYFRKTYPRAHRVVGRVFLLTSLTVSFTAILLGVFYPFSDILESLTTLVFGSYLFAGTFWAYSYALQRNFVQHQKWVIRVYFISLSVATIRIVAGLGIALTGRTMEDILGISFVIAFGAHLLAVESWIKFQGQRLKAPTGINGFPRAFKP